MHIVSYITRSKVINLWVEVASFFVLFCRSPIQCGSLANSMDRMTCIKKGQ